MSKYFLNGTYSDNNLTYSIPALYAWAEAQAVQENGLAKLFIINLHNLRYGETDEQIGSKAFLERMAEADLFFPLLVSKIGDELRLIDGIHRVYKARSQYLNEHLAYLLKELPESALIKN